MTPTYQKIEMILSQTKNAIASDIGIRLAHKFQMPNSFEFGKIILMDFRILVMDEFP
jgi:hypothetical protein